MRALNESAVSPVIGVMLMIVVTIIIAAVVAAFAGSISGDEKKPPSVSLSCKPVIQGIADTDTSNDEPNPGSLIANNGILCTHTGGDGFSLNDITIQIQIGDRSITEDLTYGLNTTGTCVNPSDANLMKKSDGTTPTDFYIVGGGTTGYIKSGDRFMLLADTCRIRSDGTKMITFFPTGSKAGLDVPLYTQAEYTVIHKPSGKAITTGTFTLQ
jgi:FlaG/FlaF family flagellin (archaellin)